MGHATDESCTTHHQSANARYLWDRRSRHPLACLPIVGWCANLGRPRLRALDATGRLGRDQATLCHGPYSRVSVPAISRKGGWVRREHTRALPKGDRREQLEGADDKAQAPPALPHLKRGRGRRADGRGTISITASSLTHMHTHAYDVRHHARPFSL